MKITYRAGKQHTNADGLNRLYDEQPTKKERGESTEAFAMSIMGLDEEFINEVRIGLRKD